MADGPMIKTTMGCTSQENFKKKQCLHIHPDGADAEAEPLLYLHVECELSRTLNEYPEIIWLLTLTNSPLSYLSYCTLLLTMEGHKFFFFPFRLWLITYNCLLAVWDVERCL